MEQKPLNQDLLTIDLLIPDKNLFAKNGMLEVTSLAILETNSDVFAKNGLFSQDIFGQVGSKERMERMGYIDFVLPVFHPLVFANIIKLGDKYDRIMKGELNARFDEDEHDFVPDSEGDTGFDFFLKHCDKIIYSKTESLKRDNRIKLVEKYGKTNTMITQMLVMPAGLREYTVDDKGQPNEDEINSLYRVLIGLGNRMRTVNINPTTIVLLDKVRYKIQRATLDIYKYIESLIDGKKKFIQNKFASRAIQYATRNVITSIPSKITDLDDDFGKIDFNTTIVGLFQYLKALGPIVFNKLVSRFLMNIVGDDNTSIYLINKNTYENELVELSSKSKMTWSTADGVNNTINKFIQGEAFNEDIIIDDHYMYLVYEDGEDIYIGNKEYLRSVIESKDPEALKDINKHLRPIKYSELFYLAISDVIDKYYALVVRYPITGHGSIYISKVYVKTTNDSKHSHVHLANGEVLDVTEYPIFKDDNGYFRSLSVHYTHLGTLGADHDGDALSFTLLFTDEAIEEAKRILDSKDFYLNSLGVGYFSPKNHVLDTVLKHITSED